MSIRHVSSPLDNGDHSDNDIFEIFHEKEIQMYQIMIGALKQMVTIESLDFFGAVWTVSIVQFIQIVCHL
jgi:hypothetical protein